MAGKSLMVLPVASVVDDDLLRPLPLDQRRLDGRGCGGAADPDDQVRDKPADHFRHSQKMVVGAEDRRRRALIQAGRKARAGEGVGQHRHAVPIREPRGRGAVQAGIAGGPGNEQRPAGERELVRHHRLLVAPAPPCLRAPAPRPLRYDLPTLQHNLDRRQIELFLLSGPPEVEPGRRFGLEWLVEGNVEVHRSAGRPHRVAGSFADDRHKRIRPGFPQGGRRGLRKIGREAYPVAEDSGLDDRLIGVRSAHPGRAISRDQHQGNIGHVRLDHRREQIGHRGAGRGDHGRRPQMTASVAQREEAGRAFVQVHARVEAREGP